MEHKQPTDLKVVRIIEPSLCVECRFAYIATVELADGSLKEMLYCRRLDCDNWDYADWEEEEWKALWGEEAA